MQRLEVSGAVRPLYGSLGVKGLTQSTSLHRIGLRYSSLLSSHLLLCLPSYLFPSGFPTETRTRFFSPLCISVTFRASLILLDLIAHIKRPQLEAPRVIL